MGVFAPGHLGELTQYLPFELDRRHARKRADSYGCVKGPAGYGGTAIKAGLLEEYVTGAVLDALESPRVQEELREGEDQHGPRRAELLEQIRDAQERREEARRDYSDRVIDRADWLDIRQRTEDDISVARREYERLAGSATVMSDIPPPQCDGRTGTPAPVTTGPGVGDRPVHDHAGAKVVNGRGVQEHQVRPEDIPDAHRCTAASGVSRCWARSLIPRSIFWLITKLTASAGSTRNRAHGLV